VLERLEVQLERLAIGAAPEPRAELVDIGRRQLFVALLPGEVHHGRGPQPTVEMVVEQRLGRLLDRLEREHQRMVATG
jgi:hypothetical protein